MSSPQPTPESQQTESPDQSSGSDVVHLPITSTIATHYLWKQVIMIVVCVGLAAWGAWDYRVKIPAQRENVAAFDEYDDLAEKRELGQRLSNEDRDRFAVLDAYTNTHKKATPPSKYDPLVCWLFISSILVVPWSAWRIHSLRNRRYTLDESGGLGFPDGAVWSAEEIADIRMDRWMAKSVARVIHTDGREVKLDAYFRKRLELIIGELAHRFDPGKWNRDGTMIKSDKDNESPDDIADDRPEDTDAAPPAHGPAEPE